MIYWMELPDINTAKYASEIIEQSGIQCKVLPLSRYMNATVDWRDDSFAAPAKEPTTEVTLLLFRSKDDVVMAAMTYKLFQGVR